MKQNQGLLQVSFCSLRQIFRPTALSKAVKIKNHYMMVQPVVVFGSET
jgi:hypothetical protein